MEKYLFNIASSNYIKKFIRDIRKEVLEPTNKYQKIILFLDPQTEFAEFKFEFYDENSNFKEIYGGISANVFNTVVELFQWTTSSMEFSFLDYETIDKIKGTFTEYFNKILPEYKSEVDYCYAIIED